MKGYKILSEWDTLQAAIKGKSLARAGDGEGALMQGRAAKSQEYDKRLSAIMRECFTKPSDKVLACVPTFDRKGPKWNSFWHKWEPRFRTLMNPAMVFGSAFVSRPDSAPHIDYPLYWNTMRSLWAGKDIMLIRGSGKSLTHERIEGANSVEEILCPVRHAFTEYDALCARVRSSHGGRTVIACCGATATAMAYELGNEGIHVVDLGHAGLWLGRREGQVAAEHGIQQEGNNGKA